MQTQYLYEIGSGPLSITLDGLHNGSCHFAVSLFDTYNLSDVSSTSPFSLAQPTLIQQDPYLPNDYTITADSVLTITEYADANSVRRVFRIMVRQDPSVAWQSTDPLFDF